MKLIYYAITYFLCLLYPVLGLNGSSYDVVVIGGGIAGVKAAVDLTNAGQKVILLEANDYLGGRMKTRNIPLKSGGNFQFDEGASWIHGNSEEHPITKLAKDVEGLKTTESDYKLIKVFDMDSVDVSDQYFKESAYFEGLLADKFINLDRSVSVRKAVQSVNKSSLGNKIFMFNMAKWIQFQNSGTIDDISIVGSDYIRINGTQRLILSGYQRFVETVAKKANFQIQLNHKVNKIQWSNDLKNSRIYCQNGIQLVGSSVVIAVSLGVLKSQKIAFEPDLPVWKKQAIKSVGFGNVCKVFLDLTGKNNLITNKEHFLGVAHNDVSKRGLARYFLNLMKLANVSALMGFGLGPNSEEVQSMEESNLKNIITSQLNILFAPTVFSNTDYQIYRSSWRSKQNFKGTYSYPTIDTRSIHWQNLAKPISQNEWYFCGEHTHPKYASTVHGAYLSGERAATQIKSPWKPNIGLILGLSITGGVIVISIIGVIVYKYLKNKKLREKNDRDGKNKNAKSNIQNRIQSEKEIKIG